MGSSDVAHILRVDIKVSARLVRCRLHIFPARDHLLPQHFIDSPFYHLCTEGIKPGFVFSSLSTAE